MARRFSPEWMFGSDGHPYYVCAPDYVDTSSGIRVLHYLCHSLNKIGQEAYVLTRATSPRLDTPSLTTAMAERHKALGREPIVVYPEITSGNPLGAKMVVRLLLNKPGFFLGDTSKTFGEGDLVYCYDKDFLPSGVPGEELLIPAIDTRRFNNRDNPDDGKRALKLLYLRHAEARGLAIPDYDFLKGARVISPKSPVPYDQLAVLFRKAEYLFTFERTAAASEALLCGCPVVYLESELLSARPYEHLGGKLGTAWGYAPEELAWAKQSVARFHDNYLDLCEDYAWQLQRFVTQTQRRAAAVYG